ncbi:unnamed protein product [Protopolystoma xenopodis]|uniref:Uncharacterized protein n=1 Tax=Protopolystoma xenopodis TaxID=117903 RepID=A0A448WT33_9PLAT|nr:unnamed protein product [Protopolystoma xenopodis]
MDRCTHKGTELWSFSSEKVSPRACLHHTCTPVLCSAAKVTRLEEARMEQHAFSPAYTLGESAIRHSACYGHNFAFNPLLHIHPSQLSSV